jgi:segregation and condensation protein A
VETASYTIELPVYEGPLDLLLELITRAELDITKVAIAQVTDQYLAYLEQIPERELADLSSFLVIAARLLLIKSEALLPRPPDREPGEEDPGDALALQLMAYKKYKQVANLLADRTSSGLKTYLRLVAPPSIAPKLDISDYGLLELQQAFFEVLAAMPKEPQLGQVVTLPKISIRKKIQLIVKQVRRNGSTTFGAILKSAKSRLEIVVSFLAILELVKQSQVKVLQNMEFGEIEISPGSAWVEGQDFEFDLEFDE